jgi:hypothetical protein
LRVCSQYEGEKKPIEDLKKAQTRPHGRRVTPEVRLRFCLSFDIDISVLSSFPSQRHCQELTPKDTAIAKSVVTTLDRVTVSVKKKGRGYISNWGGEAGSRPLVEEDTPGAKRPYFNNHFPYITLLASDIEWHLDWIINPHLSPFHRTINSISKSTT